MKSMLAAFLATIVIAFSADTILKSMGFSSQAANTGSAVRLNGAAE